MDDDVQWLNPQEIRAWLTLAGLIESLPQLLSAQLKKKASMNSFDYTVLAGLSESPNRTIGMSELASFAAGSLSRLSHALTKMEAKGWVRRQSLIEDGRQTEVVLTDDGMAAVKLAAPVYVGMVRTLFVDCLGSQQALELGRLADLMLTEVNPQGREVLDLRYGPLSTPTPSE